MSATGLSHPRPVAITAMTIRYEHMARPMHSG
eukprot:CAMPEP_0117598824 /NCGR_PEP_ID=MMETSP0784-20121206/75613_1 /TAXON_ID=39447 /ORGANISM="" /LENGTH=31 /DNA_ID= /DNA_START= /DNA_END= /DNA_ORIENTATION=